jgi:2'-5' RNA ligase
METVRSFVAIELPAPILARLGALQARLREDVPPGLVRWVRPEGIHLTLKFLGDVPVAQIEALAGALQEACAPHDGFAFRIAGLGCFPNPRRPRVIWVGVEEPGGVLAQLQRDVERALNPLGYPPEGRAYSPHLTLGRVKGRGREALEALGAYVSRSAVTVGQVQAFAVHLMRSDLRPSGAVYTELAVAPLAGH